MEEQFQQPNSNNNQRPPLNGNARKDNQPSGQVNQGNQYYGNNQSNDQRNQNQPNNQYQPNNQEQQSVNEQSKRQNEVTGSAVEQNQ